MKAKQLREDRAKLVPTINELRDKSHTDAGWSTEDRAAWDKVNADYNAFTHKIETAERAEAIEEEMRSPFGGGGLPGRDDRKPEDRDNPGRLTEERQALAIQGWCLHQTGNETEERHVEAAKLAGVRFQSTTLDIPLHHRGHMGRGRELRAMSAQTGATGAFTIAEGFVPRLEAALSQFGGVMNVAEIMRTEDGRPLPWPTLNDTTNKGERIGESVAAAQAGADPAIGSVKFGSHKYSSKLILVPYELMRDSAIAWVNWLGAICGERLARRVSDDFTTGSGAGIMPQGIVTGATLGKTAAGATAITFDDIIDLEQSVDPAYRDPMAGVGMMMHDNIVSAVRKLKDSQNRYLWESNQQLGKPDKVHGWDLQINQSMDSTLASGKKTVLFGAFKKYKVREVGSVRLRRLVERFAEADQEGFVAFMEWDGALLDAGSHPVKYLVHP